MSDKLYPFKFSPVFLEKVWGGNNISNRLHFNTGSLKNCGEMWALSGYPENETVIANGFLAGNELNEILEVYMHDLVGEKNYERHGDTFPLLVKVVDAAEYLSVQVHPDDELAREMGIGSGKTEMWYVMDAEPGAELILGFNREITPVEYASRIASRTLPEVLNRVPVSRGDVVYTPAGRVHAIGRGIMLAEIQQTSDNTFRIYDWDRVDSEGNSRELHLEEAMQAMDFTLHDDYKTHYEARENATVSLVESPHFHTRLIQASEGLQKDYQSLDSFVIYTCVEGSATIIHPGEEENQIPLRAGEAILIPAVVDHIRIIPETSVRILETYIP